MKEYDNGIAFLKSQLNGTNFTQLWEEGRKMTLDQAISYVLDGDN